MRHIRTLLWEEMERSGLIINSARYLMCHAEVTAAGRREQDRLRKFIASRDWREANAALAHAYSDDDLIRVLGFGHVLTKFTTAQAKTFFESSDLDKVVELGVLANLIVTVYDQYLDVIRQETPILTRPVLERMRLRGSRFFSKWTEPPGEVHSRVITRLVDGYFNRLEKLPQARRRPLVLTFIHHTIIAMYDAEMVTVRRREEDAPERMLRRKSALPFVVMGLPIWLVAHEVPPIIFWRHLRWLYRLGEFIGWIDDVIDLESDREVGHPNRVHNALDRASDVEKQQREIAQRIARLGERLLCDSGAKVGRCMAARSQSATVLSSVVMSWFGGTGPQD